MMFDRTRPMVLKWDRPRDYGKFRAHPDETISKWRQKKFTKRSRVY